MNPELVIDNLSKTYPSRGRPEGVQALKNVSLRIPTGMFGLLGPNGAGKSTLMRTIATLQEPDTGGISFDGLDILRQKEEVRKRLGYLPQEFGVYPKISAEAMLNHFAVLKGITDARLRKETVEGLLNQTNLHKARKARLGTFSGGMKQRFGIAQALLGNPRLIIVDEPTAGLDPEERLRFHNLLSAIGENIVVILSTHIVDDVSDLCSEMAIISEGRVLQTGQPQRAIEQLKGSIWKRVIPRNQLDDYRSNHMVTLTRLVGGKTLIHVRSDGAPDSSFESVDPNLEDVYFSALKSASRSLAA